MPFLQLAENIYTKNCQMRIIGLRSDRSMTVVTLPNEGTLVLSPDRYSPQHLAELEGFEPPFYCLIPSRFHSLFLSDYFHRCPDWQFFGLPSVLGEFSSHPNSFHNLAKLPLPLSSQFNICVLRGIPRIDEVVLFHQLSRTLIVSDMLFNLPADVDIFSKLAHSAMGVYGRPAASRFFKSSIRDKCAFASSFAEVMKWDFVRVVVGHGQPVTENAREILMQSYADFIN